MAPSVNVLFAPAEFEVLPRRDLSQSICVVFDVLRATSTIVTALANGAAAVVPVAEIQDCLALRRGNKNVLLAGERQGLRISGELAGGIEFDLGNSPREFTRERVEARTIVLTTTNGSQALRACSGAQTVLAASFLNLIATAEFIRKQPLKNLLVVCAGTFDEAALEDSLAAGALLDSLQADFADAARSDSAFIALEVFRNSRANLRSALEKSRNARRLLSRPELRDDVAWCLQQDRFPLVAKFTDGAILRL